MSQKPENKQTCQNCNHQQPCNQQKQFPFQMNDQRTKQIVLETLIEFGLIPKPERKKVLSTE